MNGENGIGCEDKGAVPSGRAFRILVVDDDSEASLAIVRALEHVGHAVSCCSHAQDALGVIAVQDFDLLLVDYRMPDMTGLDLITILREDGCKIPAIMMTGHFATEDRVPAEQLGIRAILHKPMTLPQLAKAVDDALLPVRAVA